MSYVRVLLPYLIVVGLCAGESETSLVAVADLGDQQATGVAITPDGRVFVNFPRWTPQGPTRAVAEVAADGKLRDYPDRAWNAWKPGSSPAEAFVCVQSVWAGSDGTLWVLDPAAPEMQTVVAGGAKLVAIDTATNVVRRVYPFDNTTAPTKSYLNDVRISPDRRWAFITDSGLGALVIVDLVSGTARRVLDGDPATLAEGGRDLAVEGKALRDASGATPQIHSDGIALSPDGTQLYWHALTGDILWRAPVSALIDPRLTAEQLRTQVERVASTGAHDGMLFSPDGDLYVTLFEHSTVARLQPGHDTTPVAVVRDLRLSWPDTLAFHPDGSLYITASRIQESARFNGGRDVRTEPYTLWRLGMPSARK